MREKATEYKSFKSLQPSLSSMGSDIAMGRTREKSNSKSISTEVGFDSSEQQIFLSKKKKCLIQT